MDVGFGSQGTWLVWKCGIGFFNDTLCLDLAYTNQAPATRAESGWEDSILACLGWDGNPGNEDVCHVDLEEK